MMIFTILVAMPMWCVCFTCNRSFYPSTSSTTSVCAGSSILERYLVEVMWSQNYATILHRYALSRVNNAMPCHCPWMRQARRAHSIKNISLVYICTWYIYTFFLKYKDKITKKNVVPPVGDVRNNTERAKETIPLLYIQSETENEAEQPNRSA